MTQNAKRLTQNAKRPGSTSRVPHSEPGPDSWSRRSALCINLDEHSGADTDVQVVILAAGRGSRLAAATSDRPKCLLEVGGRTLLEHQLRTFRDFGLTSIFVVAGYRYTQVLDAVGRQAAVVYNDRWAETNSLYSLWLCRHWLKGPFAVINCDVLMHPNILTRVFSTGGNACAYDSSSGDQDEHMKVRLNEGCLSAISKDLPSSDGENVGILYFDQKTTGQLWDAAETIMSERGVSEWAPAAFDRLARDIEIPAVDVCDLPWIEIDFAEDLDEARRQTWPAICGRRAEERNMPTHFSQGTRQIA